MESIPYSFNVWMIGVILSAVLYGGMLFLTLSYVRLLLTSNDISRRMRNFLLVYIIFMVANSTLYIITISIALTGIMPVVQSTADNMNMAVFRNGFAGALSTTFTSWGADGFMLWRCAMLYEGISRGRRIKLIAVLVFMGLASLVCGLAYLIASLRFVGFTLGFFLASVGVTIVLNLVTATLITIRIRYFGKYIGQTLQRNSPYTTIVIICVESSIIIIFFGLIFLILFSVYPIASILPLQMLVHIYVISPLLIVYRVAQGRGITARQEGMPVVPELRSLESQYY